MDIIKKIKLVENLTPTDEKTREIIDEFLKTKELYDKVKDKEKLSSEAYDNTYAIEYFKAKREVDSLRDENALDKFKEEFDAKYVSKKYYNDLLVRLNTIYGNIKKNYNIGNKLAIEEKISEFKTKKTSVEKTMNKVNQKLVLGDITGLDVTDALKDLGVEVDWLKKTGEKLLQDMRDFEILTNSTNFSMSPSEINKTVKDFTTRCKELKEDHKRLYNARVDLINGKIEELKNMTGLSDEVKEWADKLTLLDKSEIDIKSYTQTNYANVIDYNKLVEINKQIAMIQEKMNVMSDENVDSLESQIGKGIEQELSKIESELENEMTVENVNQRINDLEGIKRLIGSVEQELKLNEKKLTEEQKKTYEKRISDAKAKLNELRNKLNNKLRHKNEYKKIAVEIAMLSKDVKNLNSLIDSVRGHVFELGLESFEKNSKELREYLNKLIVELNKQRDSMEVSQYDILNKKLEEIGKNLDDVDKELKNPGMIKDVDIAYLEKRVNNLEKSIEQLEKTTKTDKVRNIRNNIKDIDNTIAGLEDFIKKNKNENPDKYKAITERINGLKERLNEVVKGCPLRVKTVRSAKSLYKKHVKKYLLVAGLAAVALVHATYGPIIIPAIMHGMMMIKFTMPASKPIMDFMINILGNFIGASKLGGVWTLKNGVMINPSIAATSLLKGIALSSGGILGGTIFYSKLVSSLIISIKKLVDKMKKVELKKKLSDEEKKKKEEVKTEDKKVTKKGKFEREEKKITKKGKYERKSSTPKFNDYKDELVKLFGKREKIEDAITKYCNENGLSQEEVIEVLAKLVEEKKNGRSK